MHWGNGSSSGDWLAISLMMIIFWGLVVAGTLYLIRTIGRHSRRPSTPGDRTPGRILEERYARGEIDEEEFKQRMETLSTRA